MVFVAFVKLLHDANVSPPSPGTPVGDVSFLCQWSGFCPDVPRLFTLTPTYAQGATKHPSCPYAEQIILFFFLLFLCLGSCSCYIPSLYFTTAYDSLDFASLRHLEHLSISVYILLLFYFLDCISTTNCPSLLAILDLL